MKPMNFPERKNRRRKRALARLNTGNYPQIARALSERVVADARDVRTKKYRGG